MSIIASDAPTTRLRTASGVRRCWMLRSAIMITASAAPHSTSSARIGGNHGESAMPAVVAPITIVPMISARASLRSCILRPAIDPITDPAPNAPIISP